MNDIFDPDDNSYHDQSAEMYYNYNSILLKEKENSKENTFQQSTLLGSGNVWGQAPFSPGSPPGLEVSKDEKKRKGPRRLDVNDRFIEIAVQMGDIRTGKRTSRSRIYVSLMTSDSNIYNIKLSGALTSDISEVKRSAKDNTCLLAVIDQFTQRIPQDLMLARLRYKPHRRFVSDFNRKNIRSVLIAVYPKEDNLVAELFLFDEFITIPLHDDMTEKQALHYNCAGVWKSQEGETD